MGAKKGTIPPNAGKGRPKGSKNKLSVDLRALIEAALHDVGGREYLAQQATDNPAAFMALVGKLVPKDIKLEGELRVSLESLILKSYQDAGR